MSRNFILPDDADLVPCFGDCFQSSCSGICATYCTLSSAAYAETTATGKGAIDLTGLFNAAIAVLGALVTYRLLPWLRARTTQSQQEGLYACAKTLVYAAEQLYRTGRIQNRLTYVCEELQKRGYTADREAIEAAVTQLRSDTCAYLKDLEIANVTEVEYEQNGGIFLRHRRFLYNLLDGAAHFDYNRI